MISTCCVSGVIFNTPVAVCGMPYIEPFAALIPPYHRCRGGWPGLDDERVGCIVDNGAGSAVRLAVA